MNLSTECSTLNSGGAIYIAIGFWVFGVFANSLQLQIKIMHTGTEFLWFLLNIHHELINRV